ncbi:chromobox protein homolog 1-like [Malaya genurostris]|uniref:chromobox protein homolog 1-like n=1 Tax=Malaya genurostris TaxID=325434 RepID=UPI0026F4070B|nr:chromobox protein homolog 1-like [Malaya genurostris]
MSASEDAEYVVEQILDKRVRRGKIQYFIKWKDCNSSENTWEPEENLNCPDLLTLFKHEQENKRSKTIPLRRKASDVSADKNANLGTVEYVENKHGNNDEGNEGTKAKRGKGNRKTTTDTVNSKKNDPTKDDGFSKGYIADSILGITMENGNLFFLIKWRGIDEVEMVPSKQARLHIPIKVIEFYEDRIIWNSKDRS